MKKKKGTLIKIYTTKIDEKFDAVLLFYRDEFGKKQTRFYSRAEVPFYIIKDKESEEAKNPPMFIEKEKVEKNVTYSDNLYREIAMKTGTMQYFDEILYRNGEQHYNMKNIFKHNYVYDSDMDIADRYIKYFYDEFEPNKDYKLHKCYFDIEVDLMENGFTKDKNGKIGYMGFPDEDIAPCPVNLISLLDEKTMEIHTFILRNLLNEKEKDFEKNQEEFKKYLIEKIKIEDETILNSINFYFYNTEEEVIENFFDKVHEINPDFCNAWNQSFDIKTLLNRLTKLYRNRKDLKDKKIYPKDEMKRRVSDSKYFIQKNSLGEDIYLNLNVFYSSRKDAPIVDRSDTFYILDGVNWMDSMNFFANIRKSSGLKESYSLDAIANDELGKEKLPMKPGQTMKNLSWKSFTQFVEYNIRDVLLLYLLEKKNLDFDMIQRLSEITNTRKEKVFKKTISLKNFVNKFAEKNGFIMGNNKNTRYGSEEMREYFNNYFLESKKINEHDPNYLELFNKKENFGAYVGDPLLNMNEGIELNGKKSKYIFENVFDQDFSSLYPSIIRALNLDTSTQLGKFFWIDDFIYKRLIEKYDYEGLFLLSKNEEAKKLETKKDLGLSLTDSLLSKNWSKIGEKFFNLPSTEELIKKLKGKNK